MPQNLHAHDTDLNYGGGDDAGGGSARQRGIKERKKWDNCNSIINKIYLKKPMKDVIHLEFSRIACFLSIIRKGDRLH